MNQAYELSNNTAQIITYIKNSIFNPDDDEDDDDNDYEYRLLNPEREKFIDELLNDHSVYDKFIRECIIDWYRKRHEFENVPPLSDQVINNFLRININTINRLVLQYAESTKNKINDYKNRRQSRIDYERRGYLMNAINEIKRLHTLKTKKSEKQFKENDVIRNLNDEDKNRLWNQYLHDWVPFKNRSKSTTPKLINTFSDKLDNYIANHILDTKPITEEEFLQLSRGWSSTDKKPLNDWYQEYLKRFNKRNLNIITQESQSINSLGFKSPNKIKALETAYPNRKAPDTTVSSRFPLKVHGVMLERGLGVSKNEEEACRYYKMAADKGDINAKNKYNQMIGKL